jgi:hypothetical protein
MLPRRIPEPLLTDCLSPIRHDDGIANKYRFEQKIKNAADAPAFGDEAAEWW